MAHAREHHDKYEADDYHYDEDVECEDGYDGNNDDNQTLGEPHNKKR